MNKIDECIDLICDSSEKISSIDLSRQLKCSRVYIRKMINELRQCGFPVCADSNGYWIGDKEDVMAEIKSMRSKILEMEKAIEGLEEYLMKG